MTAHLDAIRAYVAARREAGLHKKAQDMAGARLKEYLAAHPGERPYDEETQHEAFLQTKRTAGGYDVVSMPDGLILWAARHGCLQVDAKALDALEGKFIEGLDMKKFALPGGETTSLQVVRKEE